MNIIEKLGIKRIETVRYSDDETPWVAYNPKDIEQLEQQRDELIENLFDSCEMICQLCIRLNPQHENCPECDELNDLRKPIIDKTGKSWPEIKELL